MKIQFEIEGRPPRKGPSSCWSGKEAEYVLKLREKAFEIKSQIGFEDCFEEKVKLNLIVYAPNISQRKDAYDYIGDLDGLIAGVFEAIQLGPDTKIHPELQINPILKGREDIGENIPILIKDDAQVVAVNAEKCEGNSIRYNLTIESHV